MREAVLRITMRFVDRKRVSKRELEVDRSAVADARRHEAPDDGAEVVAIA